MGEYYETPPDAGVIYYYKITVLTNDGEGEFSDEVPGYRDY